MLHFTPLTTKLFGSLFLAVLTIGCGGSGGLVEIKGQVLLDGKPLPSGVVRTSISSGKGARGSIDGDGYFTLTTVDAGEGANPGNHSVAIIAYQEDGLTNLGPESPKTLLVPRKYLSPSSSELSITVVAGEPQADVKLELSSEN